MLLSIVIPTYNRNQTLLAQIERLLAQLREGVELRVLDNASTVPVFDTLLDVLNRYPNANIQVIRNRFNVGAHANILRAYEVAQAPWVWILGDDDLISETAVEDILATIAEQPQAVFINFATESMRVAGQRPKDFNTTGQTGFVRDLDTAGNVNFMSVGIWRTAAMTPWLSKAYHYAYSMSHCFVLLLCALSDSSQCHFSHKVLIKQASAAPPASKWQIRDFILGWNTILELPMDATARKILARKMLNWHMPENVCVYLLADAAIRKTDGRTFDLAARRLGPYISLNAQLRYLLYKPLFWRPAAGWRLVAAAVQWAVRLKIKRVDLCEIVDRLSHEISQRP